MTNLFAGGEWGHRCREHTCGHRGRRRGQTDGASSADMYTPPRVKQITSGELLSDTGKPSLTFCGDLEGWEKGGRRKKEGVCTHIYPFTSVQLLSPVQLFATPWTAARKASLSITNSRSPPKPMSIKSVMPSNHLILCRPLLLPSIFPSIRVFSNESALRIRWPKYWSFSFNISPSNEHPGLVSFRIDWISLQFKGLFRVFSNTTIQKHQFFGTQLSL